MTGASLSPFDLFLTRKQLEKELKSDEEYDMETQLPVMDLTNNPTGCCAVFDPAPWDEKEFSFSGLRFIKTTTRSIFYVPINMRKVMSDAQKAIMEAEAQPSDRYLMLSEDVSKWKAHHYMLVEKDVPGYEAAAIEGTWYAKAFDGPFSQMKKWMEEMNEALTAKGVSDGRILAFYTTCPGCAKEYGHNHVILFAQIGS